MKTIPGFEKYAIEKNGNVWRIGAPRNRPLRPGIVSGYPRVVLCQGNVKHQLFVHYLVLITYVGPRPPGMEARHLNGIRRDCRVSNLEWATHTVNMRDMPGHGTLRIGEACGQSKLTETDVREIRAATSGIRKLNEKYGVSRSTIEAVRSRRNWGWLT